MKTHRLVLGTLAFALSTAMASAAVAQDPAPERKPAAQQPRRAPAAKPRKPVEKKPAPAEETAEAAPEEAAPEEAPVEEAEAEQAEAEQAEAEQAEAEQAEEVVVEEEPEEEPVRRRRPKTAATSPDRPARVTMVPPAYYGPAELDYVEGGTVPPGYVKDTRVRRGLVIGGAVTWGVGWMLAATAATIIVQEDKQYDVACEYDSYGNSYCGGGGSDEVHGAAALYLPVLGPFIALGTMRDDLEGAGSALLFLNGMMQASGFSMLIAGVAAKKTVLVRDPGATISLAPAPGGASLQGTF